MLEMKYLISKYLMSIKQALAFTIAGLGLVWNTERH